MSCLMYAWVNRYVYLVRSFCADIMTPGGVLLRICPSAPELVPVFAIVTRGASVPYRDVIDTRVAHVPVIVLFV